MHVDIQYIFKIYLKHISHFNILKYTCLHEKYEYL